MMNPTLNFAATIGFDWADQKHDLWLRPADGAKPEHLQLAQTPEALHAWIAKLRERFANRKLALAVETSRGPVVSALLAYDFLVLFPVNPKRLKSYREAFAVSGAKDDRPDAQLLEELIRLHPNKLRALEPDPELTRQLGGLGENRRHLVEERTRLVNQIHAPLKTYYPLAEALLEGQMNPPMAADFLVRWPALDALQKVQPERLRACFYQHNSRSAKKTEARLAAVQQAKPLTTDPALIVPARQLVLALAGLLRPLHQAVARLAAALQQAMDQPPDAPSFRSFPGAGPALAPRILVAFGTNRERFERAADGAEFYGLAPVGVQSGNTRTGPIRYRCPKFGRQTFHENAGCALKKEPRAKCYYEQQKARNKDKHHQACHALADKRVRLYFACWKQRQPDDGARYLQALATPASPLHGKLEKLSAKQSE